MKLQDFHLQPEHSFNVRHEIVSHFYDKLHYHPQIELVFIVKGTGQQIIGDVLHYFRGGDVFLIGENVPHLWRSDEKYFSKAAGLKCEAYVIHFAKDCFGKDFFNLPENKNVFELLKKAQLGIRIKGDTKLEIITLMRQILHAASINRIILLLRILDLISTSKNIETICRQNASHNLSPSDSERINAIYDYIIKNFNRQISLKEVSSVAHLTQNAFCRYFKSRTKKSFSKFLIEVRISHACKLLAETEKPVADICYESGFNCFSNFNKYFKIITKRTPMQYRKHFHGK